MKPSELIGPALDWAVAKCEGTDLMSLKYSGSALKYDVNGQACWEYWNPSTDWAQGGPIIEREKIDIQSRSQWAAKLNGHQWHEGPTPLIAAMRCYCASKLGDEVEIPDELK
jgi:hypothetical protein